MSDAARELRREPLACDPARLCQELRIDKPMKRQPRGVLICCPHHPERDPSCSVRLAEDGTVSVKCFSCDFSADAIGLVAEVYGLDFMEAIKELAQMTGRHDLVDSKQPRPTPRPRVAETAPPTPSLSDARFDEIASAVLERCPLRTQTDVMHYLDSRGLGAEGEMAGLGALPPAPEQKQLHSELRAAFGEDLERAGLASRDHLTFASNRLIIPWRDRSGRIETLQRRRIDGSDERRYVFPRGRQMRSPFGADLFDAAVEGFGGDVEIIVAEGALDTLSRRKLARQHGQRAVVIGVPSATTLLEDVVAELAAGRDLVLSTDNDRAGDKAAEQLAAACAGRARSVVRERPRDAKDAGEVLMRRLQT